MPEKEHLIPEADSLSVMRVLANKALVRTHCVVELTGPLTDDEFERLHPHIVRPVD